MVEWISNKTTNCGNNISKGGNHAAKRWRQKQVVEITVAKHWRLNTNGGRKQRKPASGGDHLTKRWNFMQPNG